MWNCQTKQLEKSLTGLAGPVMSLRFDCHKQVLVGGGFSTVSVWDVDARSRNCVLEGAEKKFRNAIINSTGSRVLVSCGDMNLIPHDDGRLEPVNNAQFVSWDIQNDLAADIELKSSPVIRMVRNPSGTLAATSQIDKSVRIWNLDSNENRKLRGLERSSDLGGLAFLNDQELLIGNATTLEVVNVNSGKTIRTYEIPGHIANVFAAPRTRLAAVCYGTECRVIDLDSGKTVYEKQLTEYGTFECCFNDRGSRLVTVVNHRDVDCVDLDTGKSVWAKNKEGFIPGVFASDDSRLIAGSYTNLLIVDAETGDDLLALPGHNDLISTVTASSDGRDIVTVGFDDTVRIWHSESIRNFEPGKDSKAQ